MLRVDLVHGKGDRVILDTWKMSGLPAGDLAPLAGISAPTHHGRPALREIRPSVLATLGGHNGWLGQEAWWGLQRSLPREEVERILRADRAARQRRRRAADARLQLRRAGRARAIDPRACPRRVDGKHRTVLSGRNPASGAVVLRKAEARQKTEDVERDLEASFEEHGPPRGVRWKGPL